jgi:class 3 adenylate cyclase
VGLKDDLSREVGTIFGSRWTERDGVKVPESEEVGLGNIAVKLSATVLYADLASSTALVDGESNQFAAEIYKSFLHCAAKIVRSENGTITAYDGDRIMAVFLGESKNSAAGRSALKITYAVREIIRPAQKKQYASKTYELKHVVGIDTSDVYVARTGVRGANDLVWVGRAANYAAKLAALSPDYSTYVTAEVYNRLAVDVKTTKGAAMWEARGWKNFDGRTIYASGWQWGI